MIDEARPDWSGPGTPGGDGVRFHELRARRFLVARIALEPGARLNDHAHEEEQVFYVLEGAIRYQVAGAWHNVQAGEVLSIRSGAVHGGHATGSHGAVLLEVKEQRSVMA